MVRWAWRRETLHGNITIRSTIFIIKVLGSHWKILVGMGKDDYNKMCLKQMF